jgi:hypothetical protein
MDKYDIAYRALIDAQEDAVSDFISQGYKITEYIDIHLIHIPYHRLEHVPFKFREIYQENYGFKFQHIQTELLSVQYQFRKVIQDLKLRGAQKQALDIIDQKFNAHLNLYEPFLCSLIAKFAAVQIPCLKIAQNS